jgi:hypothetical protein
MNMYYLGHAIEWTFACGQRRGTKSSTDYKAVGGLVEEVRVEAFNFVSNNTEM